MKRTSILLATTAIFTASLILLSGSVTLAHSKSKDRIKDVKISEDVKMRYANDPPTEPGTLKVDPKTFKEGNLLSFIQILNYYCKFPLKKKRSPRKHPPIH